MQFSKYAENQWRNIDKTEASGAAGIHWSPLTPDIRVIESRRFVAGGRGVGELWKVREVIRFGSCSGSLVLCHGWHSQIKDWESISLSKFTVNSVTIITYDTCFNYLII